MTKEMEFAKCMALLRKAVRMELITEAEYIVVRIRMSRGRHFRHGWERNSSRSSPQAIS